MVIAAKESPPSARKWPALFHATIVACSLVLAVQILRWELLSLLSPVLEPFLEYGIYLFAAVVVVWVLIAAIAGLLRHRPVRLTLVALGICAGTFAIAWWVPFNEIELKVSFRLHQRAMTAAASGIVAGKYGNQITSHAGRGEMIPLSPGQQSLSDGGKAMFWREQGQTCVLFFVYRGILDSFSGFVYTSDDHAPPADAFFAQPAQARRLSSHWYWYASRN